MAFLKRFDPERVFRPESLNISGAETAFGQAVMANLQASHFTGTIGAALENADLAIIADEPSHVAKALIFQARLGTRGAIVLQTVPDLAELAKAAGIRVLGPDSFGILLPGIGLNTSTLPFSPAPGGVALVAQSTSLARTILDWAIPNSIGFSHISSIGGNTDIGFGLVLDHLSRDPATKAILIEIDHLRDPKLFFSAARAAARLRPVVALAPGIRLRDPTGTARAGFEAAFARAGVLLTETFGEFLAAAETLTRVKPARGDSLTILSNSVSAGRLAADYALGIGIPLSQLGPETKQILSFSLGAPPPLSGPIHAGYASPTKLADLAALLSASPEVGGILVVHTPSGEADDTAIEALIACAKTVKVPLLIAAMGEATGIEHRHRLARAGLACFETPEAAIGGFRHLIRNRRNRDAARELPSSKILKTAPKTASAEAAIAKARAAGRNTLVQDEALEVIAAYKVPVIAGRHAATPEEAAAVAADLGFPVVVKLSHPDMPTNRIAGSIALDLPDERAVHETARAIIARLEKKAVNLTGATFLVQQLAPRGQQLRIRVADDPILGPMIGFGAGGGDPDDISSLAVDLPPLNLALANALIARSKVAPLLAAHRGAPAADLEAVAATLVRVSQLIIDTPDILLLDLDPLFANENGIIAASGRISLRPIGAIRPPLVISPYPAELITSFVAKGEKFVIRPIRPEDTDAHKALFGRLSPEDIRYRFFSSMRAMPAELMARMTDVDYAREMAFIAVREETGETAGVARLVRNDSDGATAEFAVLVDAAAKGRGLATRLMRAILDWGKTQGVTRINGQILADNAPMLGFIRQLGFTVARIAEEPDIVEATLEEVRLV
jgi:acetyltransferase